MHDLDDPLVCLCKEVSEQEILGAVREGHLTLDAVREATGANTGCGDCAPDIEELIESETVMRTYDR